MTKKFEARLLELKQGIDHLDAYYGGREKCSTIRDMIECAYGRHLTAILKNAIDSTDLTERKLAEQITMILEHHWNVVRGSFLCYTSNPNSACTVVLLKLAQWVCDYKHSQGQLITLFNLLMPSIKQISTTRTHLDVVYYQDDGTNQQPYCLADFRMEIQSITDIDSLKQIFCTHVLSADSESLIPVSLLLELTLDPEKRPLIKPYIPSEKEEDPSVQCVPTHMAAPINQKPDAEFNRLINHTRLTRDILNAQHDYEAILSQNVGSLNNALRELGDGLYAGSSHGGEGKTLNASERAYAAIIKFMEYYNSLPLTMVNKIPNDVLRIIKKIQTLGSDRSQNDMTKIETEVKTCVGLMGGDVKTQLRIHEKELNKIGVLDFKDPQILKAINDAKLAFSTAKLTLSNAIANRTYATAVQDEAKIASIDKLGPTIAVIQTLGVKAIFDMKPEFLMSGGTEALKQLMRPLTLEIQAQFYCEMGPYWPSIIQNINDCKDILNVVRGTDAALVPVVLVSLERHWPNIINSLADFSTIETYFGQNHAQIKALIEIIRPKLLSWINKAVQYAAIKKYLSHDEHLSFLGELETNKPELWLAIIKEPFFNDLNNALKESLKETLKQGLEDLFQKGIDRLRENNWQQVASSVLPNSELAIARQHGRNEQTLFIASRTAWFRSSVFDLNKCISTKIKQQLKEPFITKQIAETSVNFIKQIDRCNILSFIQTLFVAHPWIRNDPSSAIVQSFLKSIIIKHLIDHLVNEQGNKITVGEMNALNLYGDVFKWASPTAEWVTSHAQIYPYTELTIFQQFLPNYPSLENHVRHSPENWINHAFSRIDVLRYLGRGHPSKMLVKFDRDQQSYLPIKLVLLSELTTLTPVDLKNTEYFLINIANEEEPFWIVIQQHASNSILYTPGHSNADDIQPLIEQTLPDLRRIFPTLTLRAVSYEHNLALNDFNADLTSKTIWHTILFTRVLAAITINSPITYRQYLPLYMLMHEFYSYNSAPSQPMALFFNRHPFSSNRVTELKATGYELLTSNFAGTVSIALFENGFDCTPNHNSSTYTLKATRSFSIDDLVNVLYILHHSPQIQTFIIPTQAVKDSVIRLPGPFMSALLDTNPNLLEIGASDNNPTFSPLYRYLECIAARNRLLQMFHPELIDIATSISERKKLWLYAGQQLLNHFQDPTAKLGSYDLSMIDASPSDGLSKSQQIMKQWQAMGILGVKQLFNAINASPDAPKLHITFDLRASNIEDPFQASNKRFIASVTERIKSYKGCAPLFQSVSLILPDSIDETYTYELYSLVDSIKQQLTVNPDKPNELFLYHVTLANVRQILEPFVISKLTSNADKHLIPRIPELDEAAVLSPNEREVKNYYRERQNNLLMAWRQYASDAPSSAMRTTITLLEKNQLPPTILLTNLNERETLSWGTDEVWTPLVEDFGTQIQVEMEQEQQHHVTTNYETKPVLKDEALPIVVTPITLFYNKPNEILITRDNIDKDPRFIAWWTSLSPEQQAHYGGSGKALFSSLFGQKQAEHLIAHVEFCAFERLFPHIPQLLGGFDRDNCIAGFELALSKPKMIGQRRVRDIVLCFDLEKENIALVDYKSKGPKERNPYTLRLISPPKVNYFLGNFCQFATMSVDPFVQQTLHQFLATDEHSEQLMASAHQHLKDNVSEEHLLVTQARFELDAEIIPPGNHQLCLVFLSDWVNDPALDCLFDIKHKAHLTIVNLKSLGQLFYQFGAQAGLRNFFHLAHQIISKEHFGEEGLLNWKKYILDLNPNWSTCLDKEELEAISLSMSTLKGNSTAQTIWWLLVEAHVKTVGYTTYSSLWYAYQKCMGYLSERQLTLDIDVIKRVLEERTPFNAQIFLETLHVLLHTHAKTLDGHSLSQHMLKHLEPSDVDRDGSIYAILYEHYPLTYKSLKLTNLTTTSKCTIPTYLVSWKPNDLLIDPIAHALRYACVRGRLYHRELSLLELQLETHFRPHLNNLQSMQVLRLYVGCITSGINTVDSLDHHVDVSAVLNLDHEIVSFLNRGMSLPDVVQKNSMKLDWHDIPTLANAISELELLPLIETLADFEAQAFINACSYAIQCYRYHAPQGLNYLHMLLDTIKTKTQLALDVCEESKEEGELQEFKETEFDDQTKPDWEHPLFQHYPWLIIPAYQHDDAFLERLNSLRLDEEQAQRLMLQKQLSTLRFEDTRYLPDLSALQDAFDQIKLAADPEATRRHIVSHWEKKGLQITLRDTKYCSLSEKEIIDAMIYLDNHLELNFKSQNKALCRRFLEKHLALPTNGNRQDELVALLEKFCNQLDNKKHYNELGIILGHLINLAKPIDETQPHKWYSAKQLTDILQLLIHSDTYKTHHYPISLLEIILTAPIANTLISSDLNQLEQAVKPTDLRNYIQDLTDNQTMPLLCKEIALEYATAGDNNECRVNAELAKDLLTALSNDTRLKPSYLAMLNQFLKEHRLQVQDYTTWQQKHVVAFRHVTDKDMQSFWQDMQIKWETQLSEPIRALFSSPANETQEYIQMILVQVLSKRELTGDVDNLRQKLIPVKAHLSTWQPYDLESLIVYCFSDKRLTLSALHVLFTDFNSLFVPKEQPWQSLLKERDKIALAVEAPYFESHSATDVIHFFESVVMAQGKAARHYSITEDEQIELLRVLSNIKRKERGYIAPAEINLLLGFLAYCNAFSIAGNLAKLEDTQLKDLARGLALGLSEGIITEEDRLYLKMQILACIREMNLRKKSIWNNHSQMVALIYLAIYGDEIGIIQKIATGDGKSVVTPQRAIYLALLGKIVDIISAKDILSQRDSERDANLIQAFGFPVSRHITPGSPTEHYETTDENGGANHYFNLGNFALFICDVIASRHESFNLYPDNRVAFLDEADYQLLDELMLQYNYAKQQANSGVYNYDEWVFRAVCEFYISHNNIANQETTFRMNESGQLCISNLRHLKPLGESLRALSITAPKQSQFIKQTLIPAVNGVSGGMQELERVLRQHLSACHSAYCLQLDKHYYIGSATRKVGDRVINVRFPYVMIDSQPKEDSTYCNGTHQYLQTRLTLEAAEKGESPDFFVDPQSNIIFTLNPVSILNTLFEKREGSTGTPGSDFELQHYRKVHQIQEVMKMPTHHSSNSTRMPTLFAKNKEEQTTYIAAQIAANQDRPFLIDCENDADVKILSKATSTVCQTFDEHYNPKQHFIVDTLDTGKSEDDILDEAGKNGSILWSARVSRGTDIKCVHDEGLFVIETGSKPKRKSKQVRGRQARHGDKGTVQSIIDFGCIQSQYDDWMNSPLKSKFEQVVEECRAHLEKKIAKHAKDDAIFWRAFDEPVYREQFLNTEAVETFKYRLNQEKVMRDAERNTLISNLSLEVNRVISRHNNDNKPHERVEHLEYKFSKLLIEIKELWNKHQRTMLSDDEQRFAFLHELNTSWIKFCDAFTELDLDKNVIQQELQVNAELPIVVKTASDRMPEIAPVTELFNMVMSLLLERLSESFHNYQFEADTIKTVLGRSSDPYLAYLSVYISILQVLMYVPNRQKEIEALLMMTLEIMNENTFFSVNFKMHCYILDQYNTIIAQEVTPKHDSVPEFNERDTRPHMLWLQGLTAFFKQPLLGQKPAGSRTLDELYFIAALTRLVVDTITTKYCYDAQALDFTDDASILFMEVLCKELSKRYRTESYAQTDLLIDKLSLLLTQHATVTSLLTRHLIISNRLAYIMQVISQNNRVDFDKRMKSFQDNVLMGKKIVSSLFSDENIALKTKMEPNRLEDYPDVIPLLFDIVFRNDEHGELDSADLPAICPSCFDEHEHAKNITNFWIILAKHSPTSKQDRNAFIDALAMYDKPHDRKNLLHAIKNIPDSVHLSHINELIKNLTPSNVDGMLANIHLYTKQSNIWFEVLKAKNLVLTNGQYWRPNFEREEEYKHLCDVFHQLSPSDSEYFFSNASFCSFATNEMKLLATTFLNHQITGNRLERCQLDAICDLFQLIKASPSPHQATLEAIFKDDLFNPKMLYQNITLFKHFLSSLSTLPNSNPIDQTTIKHLWMKWRENEIPEVADLERVVKLLKTMQSHHANPQQMTQFFDSHVSQRIINKRIFLIQCLNQDLIRLSTQATVDAYYDKLKRLLTVHPATYIYNHRQQQQQQQSYFRNLFHIIQQFFLMTQPLFKKNTAPVKNKNYIYVDNYDRNHLLNEINHAKIEYGSYFFQSQRRREMARILFSDTASMARSQHNTEIEIIKQILLAKEATLSQAGEKSWWSLFGRGPIDSKGYSRLYNITSGLLSSVTQIYLERIADEPISETQKNQCKQELYLVLKKHYINEMEQLITKLNTLEKCPQLSQLLLEIKNGLTNEQMLTKEQSTRLNSLIHISKKDAPSYLHYILDEMLILCDFTDVSVGPTP